MFILFLLLWIAAGIAGLYFLTKGIIDLIKKRSGKENLKKGGIAVLASLAFFIIAALATPAEEAEVTQNSEVETELAESKKSEETETELEVEEIVDKPEETEEVNEPEIETKEESSEVNEPAEEVEEPEELRPEDYNPDITYEDLARNPDSHILKPITFEGKIVQVIQGDESSQYRLAANGNYDNMFLVEISSDKLDQRILEDDYIRFYGYSMGEITYESALGGNITVPGVLVNEFEFK